LEGCKLGSGKGNRKEWKMDVDILIFYLLVELATGMDEIVSCNVSLV